MRGIVSAPYVVCPVDSIVWTNRPHESRQTLTEGRKPVHYRPLCAPPSWRNRKGLRGDNHARHDQDDVRPVRPSQLPHHQEQAHDDGEVRHQEVLPGLPQAPRAQRRKDLEGLTQPLGARIACCMQHFKAPRTPSSDIARCAFVMVSFRDSCPPTGR